MLAREAPAEWASEEALRRKAAEAAAAAAAQVAAAAAAAAALARVKGQRWVGGSGVCHERGGLLIWGLEVGLVWRCGRDSSMDH